MNYSDELEFIKNEMFSAFQNHGKTELNTVQKSAFDLVTDIDLKIEKRLTAAIRDKYPSDRIHGEEFSSSENIDDRTWTIDPIDGTCNMASGSGLYGMQCSLIENGEIVLGIVYLPHFEEWIYATKNSGCYCNGRQIKINDKVKVNNAIVSFGDYPHNDKEYLADIQHIAIKRLYSKIAKIRMFGAACMDFSFVAQGRTHGTVVITKNVWDIAPGLIICKEAGAVLTNLVGLPYKFGDDGVVAASNEILSELITDSFSQKYEIKISGHKYDFSACIFDFDGVIADTEKFYYKAWRKAINSIGFDLTEEEYLPLKSTGRNNILAFFEEKCGKKFTDEQRCELLKIKDDDFKKAVSNISKNDMIAGAEEFLQRLKCAQIKTGVASSSKTAKELINKLSLNDMFGVMLDGQTDLPKKPLPDIFLKVMKMLGVEPATCLVFEDSPSGIEAAVNAGATVIAVGGIEDTRAVARIDDFYELKFYED